MHVHTYVYAFLYIYIYIIRHVHVYDCALFPPPLPISPNGIHHLVLPAPLLWDGLGIELARGMVWLFGLGLLAMVVHVIIPHPPWERLGVSSAEFTDHLKPQDSARPLRTNSGESSMSQQRAATQI